MPVSPHVFDFCDTPLPFTPGKSPFRIKGEFYRHSMRGLQRLGEEFMAGLDAELQVFCAQNFLAAGWYDVLPFPRLAMAEAAFIKKDLRELTRERATRSAERSMTGVYAVLLKIMSARAIGVRAVASISQFYNFGRADSEAKANGLIVRQRQVPLPIIEWWCLVTSAYLDVVLRSTGVTGLATQHSYKETGSAYGVTLGTAELDLRWV